MKQNIYPPLIGITGQMGSGKTTIAKLILSLAGNFELFSIGQKIKNIVFELDLPYKREILQETGDFFRIFDPLVWVKYLINHIEKQNASHVIIDDIRYKEECVFLKKRGFIIIRVVSKDQNRRERIKLRDKAEISDSNWNEWNQHKNEKDTTIMNVDHEIINNGSIDDLVKEIEVLFKSLSKKSRNLKDFIPI
ncbi:MAG: AAA family ATPase [Candidatus Thorarchaeota archaeon]